MRSDRYRFQERAKVLSMQEFEIVCIMKLDAMQND